MSILVKGMDMPKDCPQCPCSYWADHFTFLGCNVKPGKRYAMRDEEYRKSSTRPNWCPLVEVSTPHGRLIDADALKVNDVAPERWYSPMYAYEESTIDDAPIIIEAEE